MSTLPENEILAFSKYFDELETEYGIKLTEGQKDWYTKKAEIQAEFMKREFPSTPDEAFETINAGYYLVRQLYKARTENRICNVQPDDYVYKFAAMDIGWSDATAVWTFQVVGREVHLLDYYENSGEALPHYAQWIRKLPYEVHKIFLPHDAAQKNPATGKCFADYVRDMGFKIEVLRKSDNKLLNIEMLRMFFPRLYFNEKGCSEGIKCVENYRKEWNEKKQCFREKPFHNWASHGTEALIYVIIGVQSLIGNQGLTAEQWQQIRSKYV